MDVFTLQCSHDSGSGFDCTGQVDTGFFAIPIIGFGVIVAFLVAFLIMYLVRE